MAARERRLAPSNGGVFVPKTTVLSATDVQRAATRIAHEIIERNRGVEGVALPGLQTWRVAGRAPGPGHRPHRAHLPVPLGTLDVAFYRDDIDCAPSCLSRPFVPVDLTARTVICARRRRALHQPHRRNPTLNSVVDLGRP